MLVYRCYNIVLSIVNFFLSTILSEPKPINTDWRAPKYWLPTLVLRYLFLLFTQIFSVYLWTIYLFTICRITMTNKTNSYMSKGTYTQEGSTGKFFQIIETTLSLGYNVLYNKNYIPTVLKTLLTNSRT